MTSSSSQPVKAVLGPTNTGKTHLAVERLTAHSSGMIGFPLRLLAREVYDRVVAIKGEKQVALVPFFLQGVGGNPQLMQADGIHPAADAQGLLLENVWPALKALL